MPNDQYSNEASTSGCNKHLLQLRRASTLSRAVAGNSSNFNRWKKEPEIERLGERLKILEEEAEMLKEALLESVEESRTMITDIDLHFKTIRSCLLQRGSDREESYSHGIEIVKERRAGLLQILYQESNPSIVNKGFRNQSIITRFDLS